MKKQKNKQKILAFFAAFSFLGGFFVNFNVAQGASYTFNQTSWSGGQSSSVAAHTSNQTGWDKYSTKDSATVIANGGADVESSIGNASIVQTTNTDFNTGTYTSNTKAYENNVTLSNYSRYLSQTDNWNGTKYNTESSSDGGSFQLKSPGETYNAVTNAYRSAFDSYTNSIWVTNGNSQSVSKFNTSTGERTDYAASGTPDGIVFESETNSIWVANFNSPGTVSRFNVETGTRTDISVGFNYPQSLAYNPITETIWVVGNGSQISIIGVNAGVGYIPTVYSGISAGLLGIAYDSATESMWVGSSSANIVIQIDATTGAVKNTYDANLSVFGLAFDPVTNSIWASGINNTSAHVSKISVSDGTKSEYSTYNGNRGITFDPVTNSIWLIDYQFATKINVNDEIKQDYYVASANQGITFESVTNSVWITTTANKMVKISVTSDPYTTGTYTDRLDAGYSGGNEWSGKTARIYTANGGTVSFKLKTSSDGTNPPSFDSGTCNGSVTDYNYLTINLTSSCSNTSDRYLWYQATLTRKYIATSVSSLDVYVGGNIGTYTSAVIDTLKETSFNTLNYSVSTSTYTNLDIDVRAGNTATPDGTWTDWLSDVSSGASLSSFNGNRYIQYQARLSTTTSSNTPSFNDITINYDAYPTSTTLTSSVYNTTFAESRLRKIEWTETLPSNTDIKFQIRTSSNNSTWTSFVGPDGTTSTYFTSPTGTEDMPSMFTSGSNDQYFQYKAYLSSSDGVNTPTLSDVIVTYTDAAPPSISGFDDGGLYFDSVTPVTENGDATLNGNSFTSGTAVTEEGEYTVTVDNGEQSVSKSFTILKNKTVYDPDSTKMNEDYTLGIIDTGGAAASTADEATIKVNYTLISNSSSLYIPRNTIITSSEEGTIDITKLTTLDISQSINNENSNSKGAIKIGIPNQNLAFSQPVTVTMDVQSSYNGKILTVYSKPDEGGSWTYETTCLVADSKCTFTTSHATEYTGNYEVSNSPTPTDVNVAIDAIISLTCTDSITMGTITGTGQSNLTTNEALCTVSTNNSTGYALYWQASTAYLENGTGDQITSYTPTTPDTPENWEVSATESEWGAKLKSGSTTYNSTTWGDDDTYSSGNWINISAVSPYQIITRTTETAQAGDSETLLFGAEIGSNKFQPTGTYDVDVTVTATTL